MSVGCMGVVKNIMVSIDSGAAPYSTVMCASLVECFSKLNLISKYQTY